MDYNYNVKRNKLKRNKDMKVEELKKFIIKARSNDAVKFSEFAETLYTNCDSLREELFKKYQFRNSKTFEIVDCFLGFLIRKCITREDIQENTSLHGKHLLILSHEDSTFA